MTKRENFIKKTTNTLIVGLHVEMIEEDGHFVAYCPALELSSYGKNADIARKRFEKELEIFFVETTRKGTLDKYLLKMGWTLRKKPVPQYIPPEIDIKDHLRRLTSSFTENVTIPVC